MKVVFLDVDGVINSSRSVMAKCGVLRTAESNTALEELQAIFKDWGDEDIPYGPKYTIETIDPVAVFLVNRLMRETSATLVLSTSHRDMFADANMPAGSQKQMHLLGLYFTAMGIKAPIYDITPKLFTQRGAEVKHWLDNSAQAVTHYVILDDGRDFNANQNLIWCDPDIGFSHANYFAASRELGQSETSLIY